MLGIFPKEREPGLRRLEIKEINRRFARLCDGRNAVFFDFGDQLVTKDGTLAPEISSDGIHLTTKVYEIWAENLVPKLAD